MSGKLSIVFMGTPDFAVPCLKALTDAGHGVSLVVTQPDRPKGRGRRPAPPPVKTAAAEAGIAVIQPESPRESQAMASIAAAKPDLLVVVAYGHILSRALLNMPRLGAINVHASLLPKYRGPAPIQWAIVGGETETGVTTMHMDTGMDTGDILDTATTPIGSTDTAADLHDRLAAMGAALLAKTVDRAAAGALSPTPQDHRQATYAPMLSKADGRIDWQKNAAQLDAFIRGMTPWPGAFTFAGERRLKIFAAAPLDVDADAPPGTVIRGFPDELRIAAGRGALNILEIQGASGKRMGIRDFLMGADLPPGTVFN